MPRRIVRLWSMPDEVMLVVECPSGVVYENQVGGSACWQAQLEGALSPVDISPESSRRIMELFDPYDPQGIPPARADIIDAILAAEPGARTLRVDRERLDECWEAWVHVVLESPSSVVTVDDGFLGAWFGFGAARGVLTWPNSD